MKDINKYFEFKIEISYLKLKSSLPDMSEIAKDLTEILTAT